MLNDTIATVICAIALTLCVAPSARALDDPLLAPPGTCKGDDDPDAQHRTQRLAMHCLIAYVREQSGLQRLASSDDLRHSATYKARRIAACKVFTHNPCGDKLDAPFQQAQVTRHGRWLVGEDLAWGVGDQSTARVVLYKWLHSPTHRKVLLTKSFSHLGIRRRRLKMKGAPAGSILWVAHLGHPVQR